MKKVVNGVEVEMLPAEIAAREAEAAAWEAGRASREAEAAKSAALKLVEQIRNDPAALALLKTELSR